MNRNTRTLIVVAVGLLFATGSAYLVYRSALQLPARPQEAPHVFAVVAARSLGLGSRVTKDDVKLVAWPPDSPVPNGYSTVAAVLNRGVIAPISLNQPLTAENLATIEAGAGLPPSIPPGMRAISVRVNEVNGVAGFVVPGTRVDVMVIMKRGAETISRVVASNIQVLTAGTRYDQDVAREGKPIPSTVVTLMVTQEDAGRIGLAGAEGQIMLTLRNPLDTEPTISTPVRMSALTGEPVSEPRENDNRPARARQAIAPAPAPPAAPPPPPVYKVETIRAAKRSEETLR